MSFNTRDLAQQQLQQARQRYRDAGMELPVLRRKVGNREQELLTYAAPGMIVAGHSDPMSIDMGAMTSPESMPVVTWATTTERVIRNNERMEVAGVKLSNFFDNPVILWSHIDELPPIGKGFAPRQSVVKGEKAMLLDIRFNCVTQLGREVCCLVMLGDISAGSHGFIPLASRVEPASRYPDAYPHFPSVVTYTSWEMLEFSLCTIPMNPAALRQHSAGQHSGASSRSAKALDPEFEARLRHRIQCGLIGNDGEGVVWALGGNAINAGNPGNGNPGNGNPGNGNPSAGAPDATAHKRYVPKQNMPASAPADATVPDTTTPTDDTMPTTSTPSAHSAPGGSAPSNGASTDNAVINLHEYQSVWEAGTIYAAIPDAILAEITRYTSSIKPEDLAPSGVQEHIFVPVMCCVTTRNPDVIRAALVGAEAFDVTLGATSVVTADEWCEHDCLFLDFVSSGAEAVARQLSDQVRGYTDTRRVLLAVMKAGKGADYAERDQLAGRTFPVTELIFRDVNQEETVIELAPTTQTHIQRVRNITMPKTKTHDATGVNPDGTLADPAMTPTATPDAGTPAPDAMTPADEDMQADADETAELAKLKGLDFDLAYLANIKVDVKSWLDMSALAATNSNRQDVKDLAGSVTEAANTILAAINQIMTDLGVDMSGEQPANGQPTDGQPAGGTPGATPVDGAGTPAQPTGATASMTAEVAQSWAKAQRYLEAKRHVGATFSAKHKALIAAAHDACTQLHTAAFGTENPKTGTASAADFEAFKKHLAETFFAQHEADMRHLTGQVAVLHRLLTPEQLLSHELDSLLGITPPSTVLAGGDPATTHSHSPSTRGPSNAIPTDGGEPSVLDLSDLLNGSVL